MLKKVTIGLVLIVLALPATAQDFKKGLSAYNSGDYLTALLEWYPLAAKGDAKAQNSLGVMYENGEGVVQDYAEAVKWYRRAAEHGSSAAKLNIGSMYGTGRGLPQDHSEAVTWYQKAAELGDPLPITSLGFMRGKGIAVPQFDADAETWLRKAAKQNDADARKNLRSMQEKGRGLVTNARSAATRGAFRVQLSSIKSKARALTEARHLVRVHKSVLGDLKIAPVRTDLGKRGVFFRLRSGPISDRAAANSICRKLSARKQGCIVIKP